MSEQPGAVEYRTTAFGAKPKARRQHQTTLPRALLGVGAGALFGGVLLAASGSLAFGLSNSSGVPEWIMFIAVVLCVALGIAVETALIAPLWRRLHRRGHTQWRTAVLVGAAAGALGGALVFAASTLGKYAHLSLAGTIGVLLVGAVVALMAALPGAAVGALVWRIAYRRAPSVAEVF